MALPTGHQPKRRVRLLHTSDTHLDANHTNRDDHWRTRRRQMQDAFRRMIDIGIAEDVDALVLAGDIFDHRRPGHEVVEFLVSELTRFGRTSILLPGNHDAYEDGSVWKTHDIEGAVPGARLIRDPAGQAIVEHELGVVFWGRANTDADIGLRPLHGIPARSHPDYWHVAVAHGHHVPEDEPSYRSWLIRPSEIAASGWDYIALGHWEQVVDVSHGDTVAWYSGTPMPLVDGGPRRHRTGSVALADLDPGRGVRVAHVLIDPPAD